MRKLAWMWVAAALTGCSCGEDARDAAVRLELSFSGFHPGCLRVVAQDAADASQQRETAVSVADGERTGTRTVAVFREDGWSRELIVRAIAHEGSCEGPQVAQQEQTVHLPAGEIQPLALALTAADVDEDGYVAQANGGTDCDDAAGTVHPTAVEQCNAVDDDCDGPVDEDLGLGAACEEGGCPGTTACQADSTVYCAVPELNQVFPDGDEDGHGAFGADPIQVCGLWGPDGGQSATADDCDDLRADVYPDAPEKCDGVDNSCDGAADEGFGVGDGCDPGGGGCPGLIACDAEGSAFCSSSGQPAPRYLDDDLDGQGAGLATGTSCDPLDAGLSLVASDCDDGNPYVSDGGVERCDGLDNDCDGTADNGSVCANPPEFIQHNQGGGNEDWISVTTWADGGTGVWIAGVGDRLRVRPPGGSSFIDQRDDCADVTWEGAWADPRSGAVYLGGRTGVLARHELTGTSCQTLDVSSQTTVLSALHGFEVPGGVGLLAVSESATSLGWDGGASASSLAPLSGTPCLEDVHGLSPELTFAVGGTSCTAPNSPLIFRLDPANAAWVAEDLSATGLSGMRLLSVHVVNSRLAYAVGGDQAGPAGMAVWNGATWAAHPIPPGVVQLTGVTAFGRSAVVVVGDKKVWRYDGTSWTDVYIDGDPLWDVSGTSPGDLWVVGDNGTVVHWPD